jgi:hypothetical protein
MKLRNINAIHIKWYGPMTLKEVEQNKYRSDYGVYQIYGVHPVYGRNVLLYIGKSDEQLFSKRFKQHRNLWLNDSLEDGNYTIYVGRLMGEFTPNNEEWSRNIDIAERLLIYSHSPAYNSDHINSVGEDRVKNFIIFNWGKRGSLLPEVSGMRMTDKYWEELDKDVEKLKSFKAEK